jgi:hypothetical protein
MAGPAMSYIRVIYVEWLDSQTEVGWSEGEVEELSLTISVGIFIKETKDAIVIANSYDPETGENNGRIYIPLSAIKKIRTLCQIQTPTT